MTTSPLSRKALVIETRYVWGKTISDAMTLAYEMGQHGWKIEGNPAPMSYDGQYGTGVAISRVNND